MKHHLFAACALLLCATSFSGCGTLPAKKEPVDYVNPYMGNISHMLQPTFPVTHLPNGMLKVRPERADYTVDRIHGLELAMPSYISTSPFRLSPWQGEADEKLHPVYDYTWDNERVTPYSYRVRLEEPDAEVRFAPSYRSALYEIRFETAAESRLILDAGEGTLTVEGNAVRGSVGIGNGTVQYLYLETDCKPHAAGSLDGGTLLPGEASGRTVVLGFGAQAAPIRVRYGISYIDTEQAKRNLEREIEGFDLDALAAKGRAAWNRTLSKIEVEGGTDDDKAVLYTSLYRTYNRMIEISEEGRYFSAFDGRVHDDEGMPFYTDDWAWDTYKCVHPLRTLIDAQKESHMIASLVRMARQSPEGWLPTFPQVQGDPHGMNGNHGIIVIADALAKGLGGFDPHEAFDIARRTFLEETHAPWVRRPAGEYDCFYRQHGYFPALEPGEKETLPEIHDWERRQAVAVSLGASYDAWALARIAGHLGLDGERERFAAMAADYRKLYNARTGFFHPRNRHGDFIEPFDYKFAGGMGARDYYDENNAWTYRWDVQHDIDGLIGLMGGPKPFEANLDNMFREELGAIRWDFWDQFPDHTAIVGQFSMANEPSMHIPYLYNYVGAPWKTQKRVRSLMRQWFRNDLMGVPGDEDGGGLSAFAVFSSIGLYPVTPGTPFYNIGSPLFERTTLTTDTGKRFEILARGCSEENKYIRSATLDGRTLDRPWLSHAEIVGGGRLVLTMDSRPNKSWGAAPHQAPPTVKP